jgi:hypothetical protein
MSVLAFHKAPRYEQSSAQNSLELQAAQLNREQSGLGDLPEKARLWKLLDISPNILLIPCQRKPKSNFNHRQGDGCSAQNPPVMTILSS